MKKKNFIILLLMPFVFALFGIFTLNFTFNIIDNDILAISWEYEDTEAFSIHSEEIELKAQAVTDNNYPLQQGNSLVWKIENVGEDKENNLVTFKNDENKGETIYLIPSGVEGEIKVTCSNEKGNVFRSMNIILYENSAVVVNPKNKSSQNNIDPNFYYGEYDLVNGKKEKSYVEYSVKVYPEDHSFTVKENTPDLIDTSAEKDSIKVSIKNGGTASFTVSTGSEQSGGSSVTKTFKIVDEGVNVYNYDDLLYCTNKSQNGEIVVLRKSFESLQNTYKLQGNGKLDLKDGNPQYREDNVTLFGTLGEYKEASMGIGGYYTYNFANEVYKFETKFNHEYIKEWNEYASKKDNVNSISDLVNVGLRVQKDFYGNGYTINFHNLTFPYSSTIIDTGDTAYRVPVLTSDNIFRGPLPFYTLGDPNSTELITAFGQDNIGLYVDGDNIIVNDVNIKNCDFGNMLSNLDYVGTVLDISGNNITIKNCRLSNGKNVARSFSSTNVIFQNCLLSNSRNFLLDIGNNEFNKIDGTKEYAFYNSLKKEEQYMTLDDYLVSDREGSNTKKQLGDSILNEYLFKGYKTEEDINNVTKALNSIQKALDQESLNKDEKGNIVYKGDVTLNDCYFYQSGIASIAMESYFNGPFLYNQRPSFVSWALSDIANLIPKGLDLSNISGTSVPTTLKIEGKTAFYDYKVTETIDLTGLIREKISGTIKDFVNLEGEVNIDTIFPLKPYLVETAKKLNYVYNYEDKPYLNIPIAYYGGALNLSKVEYGEDADVKNHIVDAFEVELLQKYLTMGNATGNVDASQIGSLMLKCVNLVTGFHPFKFICYNGDGYDFDKTPDVNQLVENAKEEME